MECVALIDISLEDDLLIPSSSQGLGFEAFSNLEAENIDRLSKQMEELSELSESPQQKRRRSDRYSLRKSLAWDSEFFTSEGVLNPEELAIYNSSYSKAIGLKLPGIHEELRKSAESTSTLDSGSRASENLEVHLYENHRASGKRTLVASNQSANMEHSGKAKEQQRKPDKPHLRTLKKLGTSSQTKVASGIGQLRTSIKSPEISSTTPLRPMHGKSSSSLVNKQIKPDRGKVLPGIASRSIPSKDSSLRTPRSGSKLTSASGASSSRPTSSSSDSSSSRLTIIRSSTRNNICYSSSFSSKTPSKTTRSLTGSTNQICDSGLGKSTLLLSKVSPSTSIDSFLSGSSSQTSSSTKHTNSLKGSFGGLSSSSSITISSEKGASQKSGGTLSQSFIGNHSKTTSKFDSETKPTTSLGLRMPRPRIGYFDKEKTPFHGSNKHLQTSLSSSLAKSNGINNTSAANKSKLTNPTSIRSRTHSYSLNQTSKSTGGYQIIPKTTDRYQLLSPNPQKESSPKTAEGNCKKSFKNKIEHPNLLQLKSAVMENGIHESGEQRIKQEDLQSELSAFSSTGKENLCPDSKP